MIRCMGNEVADIQAGPSPEDMNQAILLFAKSMQHGLQASGFKTHRIASAMLSIRAQGFNAVNAQDTKIFVSQMIDTLVNVADTDGNGKVAGSELYALNDKIFAGAQAWLRDQHEPPQIKTMAESGLNSAQEYLTNAMIKTDIYEDTGFNHEAARCVAANLVDGIDRATGTSEYLDNALPAIDLKQVGAGVMLSGAGEGLQMVAKAAMSQCAPILVHATEKNMEPTSGLSQQVAIDPYMLTAGHTPMR